MDVRLLATLLDLAAHPDGIRWSEFLPGIVAPLWGRGFVDVDERGVVRLTKVGERAITEASRYTDGDNHGR